MTSHPMVFPKPLNYQKGSELNLSRRGDKKPKKSVINYLYKTEFRSGRDAPYINLPNRPRARRALIRRDAPKLLPVYVLQTQRGRDAPYSARSALHQNSRIISSLLSQPCLRHFIPQGSENARIPTKIKQNYQTV